eukprot:scpid26270/ scgid11524/ Ceramide glucosyltransferase; GLCT-1; Glucosylceramide synthase; UDP-glucose ceramide glucosyltransferase; UDP-glucose:N-acylsphingosine D-glucosyltransferase
MFSKLLFGISVIVLITEVVLAIFHVVALAVSFVSLHGTFKRKKDQSIHHAVSIIKPLLGADGQEEVNLESFFQLDYEIDRFELLMCVESKEDPVIPIVQRLQQKYPNVRSQLFIGAKNVGLNPKINNMVRAVEAARCPWLWIADSGIYAKHDSLQEMVRCVAPEVGLIHQLPFTTYGNSFTSYLNTAFFGTSHARAILVSHPLNLRCINGMSCMIRKGALEQVGGLEKFSAYVAEDHFLVNAIMNKGWKAAMCTAPALQNHGRVTLSWFFDRLIRWTRLRFTMLTFLTLLEPFTEMFVMGAAVAAAVSYLFLFPFWAAFGIHVAWWALSDFFLLHRLLNEWPKPKSLRLFLPYWFRQLTAFPLFLFALSSRKVFWGRQRYKLLFNGRAVVAHDEQARSTTKA